MSYSNIVWKSNFKEKIGKVIRKQKHPVRTIFNKGKISTFQTTNKKCECSKFLPLKILHILKFFNNDKHDTNSRAFTAIFKKIHHTYVAKFSVIVWNNQKQWQKPLPLSHLSVGQIFKITVWTNASTT